MFLVIGDLRLTSEHRLCAIEAHVGLYFPLMKWAEQICALFVGVQFSLLIAASQALLLPSSLGKQNVLTSDSKFVPERRLHPGTTQQCLSRERFIGIILSAENIETQAAAATNAG